MSSDTHAYREQFQEIIDAANGDDGLSSQELLDLYQEVAEELQGRIDGLLFDIEKRD
jgi:hypothetical protein